MRLNEEIFQCVLKNAPLISIDFIVYNCSNQILLGKRINEPAKGYWFTVGGRILKNEDIISAKYRILKEELNYINRSVDMKFVGIFEHFYSTGFKGIPTHYINLAYSLKITDLDLMKLPKLQHNDYIWINKEKLLQREDVHKYVKDFFIGSR